MDPRHDTEKRVRARKLYEEGASVREVAEMLGLSVSRTYTLLDEAGTVTRSPGRPRKESDAA